MSSKAIFVLLAQALLIQSALSQCTSRAAVAASPSLTPYGLGASGLAYDGLLGNSLGCNGLAGRYATNGLGFDGLSTNWAGRNMAYDGLYAPAIEIAPTSGGALPVSSASAVAPNSILVESENVYEGTLDVIGELPFVGTVGMEGVLPTTGSGAVNHACGNGATRMTSPNGAAVSAGLNSGFAPSIGGYGSAIASPLGCRNGMAGLAGFGNTGLAGIGNVGLAGIGNIGLSGLGTAGFAGAYPGVGYTGAYPAAGYATGLAPYGGAGEGNVAVIGELPVAGNTAVAGQVPIMGAVRFDGAVPAAGAVSIAGQCACGCGSANLY